MISAITRPGVWNPGGGNKIELIPVAAVRTYTRASSEETPLLEFHFGWDWTPIYCTPGTIEYNEDCDPTDNGDLHTIQIKGFTPSDSKEKRIALSRIKQYLYFLVRFIDNDGLTRIAGTKSEFLTLSYKFGTDSDVPGSRGYNLLFDGKLTSPVAYE